jgi:hypothetical protein
LVIGDDEDDIGLLGGSNADGKQEGKNAGHEALYVDRLQFFSSNLM